MNRVRTHGIPILEQALLPERYGCIYKLWHSSDPDVFYVGSTKTSLAKRLQAHKSCVKSDNYDVRVYNYLREKGVDGIRIELLEQVSFLTTNQLRQHEDRYIRALKPLLNQYNAVFSEEKRKQSKDRWYSDNKEAIKSKNLQWKRDNRNRFNCALCDYHCCHVYYLNRHISSTAHKRREEDADADTDAEADTDADTDVEADRVEPMQIDS